MGFFCLFVSFLRYSNRNNVISHFKKTHVVEYIEINNTVNDLLIKFYTSCLCLCVYVRARVCTRVQLVQPFKDEENQETALSGKAPQETEKMGRLHFTLDYNFTDNMVR